MKRSSCVVIILMFFSGIRPGKFDEYIKSPEIKSPQIKSPLHNENFNINTYEQALRRAQLRAEQAKGPIHKVITKAIAKVRSALNLPPKPETLVKREPVDGLTVAEEEALKHFNIKHTFKPPTQGYADTSKESISREEVRIVLLKARINTVLADKANYSSTARINELVKEVDSLVVALEETVKLRNVIGMYPDSEAYFNKEEDDQYLETIKIPLGELKEIQKMQKQLSKHDTGLKKYIGNKIFGPTLDLAERNAVFLKMVEYLVADSRSFDNRKQNLTLQPGLLLLESIVRKQAFEFCKPIFIEEYSSKSPEMKKNVLQFFKDYEKYQKGTIGKIRIEFELTAIINPEKEIIIVERDPTVKQPGLPHPTTQPLSPVEKPLPPNDADSIYFDVVDAASAQQGGEDVFYSVQGDKDNRDNDFEEALPEAMQIQVKLAMGSIGKLKVLAARFSVHAKSVDSIGLAEKGFSIVTTFENSMPKNILDHNDGALQGQINILKLLFDDAIKNQKLAVVASLQALRASVAREFGETVFPPVTADFKAQVALILTPQLKDSLSKDSAFSNFAIEVQKSLDSTTETKTFFTLLDTEQATLKNLDLHYIDKNDERVTVQDIKDQDQDVKNAFDNYPKQGALAATEVIIPKLEDAYALAIFETLTDPQKEAFKAHNKKLYEDLILRQQGKDIKDDTKPKGFLDKLRSMVKPKPKVSPLQKFINEPFIFLENQGESALGKMKLIIDNSKNTSNPNNILAEINKLKKNLSSNTLTVKELKTLILKLKDNYKPFEDAYNQYQDAIDFASDFNVSAPLAFQKDLQTPEGRKQTLEDMAKLLGVKTKEVFTIPRKILQAKLIATGKTTSQSMERPYRDLAIPLRSDILWNSELAKLQGRPVVIPEKVKEKMINWAINVQESNSELKSTIIDINFGFEALTAELAEKV